MLRLQAQGEVVYLGAQLLMVSNLDEMLNTRHHCRDDMRLQHLTGLLADDNLGAEVTQHPNIPGEASCRDTNHICRHKSPAVDLPMDIVDCVAEFVGGFEVQEELVHLLFFNHLQQAVREVLALLKQE